MLAQLAALRAENERLRMELEQLKVTVQSKPWVVPAAAEGTGAEAAAAAAAAAAAEAEAAPPAAGSEAFLVRLCVLCCVGC
jgi:hypothetical protein